MAGAQAHLGRQRGQALLHVCVAGDQQGALSPARLKALEALTTATARRSPSAQVRREGGAGQGQASGQGRTGRAGDRQAGGRCRTGRAGDRPFGGRGRTAEAGSSSARVQGCAVEGGIGPTFRQGDAVEWDGRDAFLCEVADRLQRVAALGRGDHRDSAFRDEAQGCAR